MSTAKHPAAVDVAGTPYLRDAKGSLVPLAAVKPVDLLMDETVRAILTDARELSALIAAFKARTFERVGAFQALLAQEYGTTVGEKSIGALYDRAGFEGRHVPHGWRASFSTMMNEKGADGADIERALAHTPKDKVKAAYDRSARLQRLRDLFQDWSDMLVGI